MPTDRRRFSGPSARAGSLIAEKLCRYMRLPTLSIERDPAGSSCTSAEQRLPRWWIPMLTLAVVVTGMAYTLLWPRLIRHASWYWLEPGDIWSSIRSAHWIGWGGFSFIYSAHSYLVTLPGFHVFLTPVVILSSKFGLTEAVPGLVQIPKPTAWLLVGPLTLACSGVAVYGLERLARTLGVSVQRRQVLAILAAAALWPTLVMWGHPEDVLALGLTALALEQALSDHWTASAWLMGGALCMQLYTIGVIPIFVGLAGLRRAAPWLARAAVLPGALLLAVLIPNPHATLHALLNQPNYPREDYPTPWVLLAPKLGADVVASGPSRVIGLLVACGLGVLAARFRRNPLAIICLLGAALAVRCLFETVMDAYYGAPAVAVVLVVVAGSHWLRLALASIASAGLTVQTYIHSGMWAYWGEMTAILVALFLVATYRRSSLASARFFVSRHRRASPATPEPYAARIHAAG